MRQQRRDTSNLTGLRVGVYLRVSRADKEDKKQLDVERSTSTQRRVYTEWADRAGVELAAEYADPDISASRFAVKKNRPEFERMVSDVRAGKLDVLWFWEISRQQRRLDVFAHLRDLCRDMGVLWVIRDRVADPANSQDMLLSGIQTMIAEDEAEKLSQRVFDGKESAAVKGRRAGRFPYGYKRGEYDPATDTFGPDQPNLLDGDRNALEDTPAYIVREIFERIMAGHSITGIRRDLNRRGILSPGGTEWSNSRVRYIAMNPAYAGLRVRHIEKGAGLSNRAAAVLPGVETKWPPLIGEETFWAVYRRLADPARTTTRPDRPGGRLLSGVGRCGECGCKLTIKLIGENGRQREDMYACREKGCTGIYESDLDEYVTKVMIRWLSLPETAEQLAADGDSEKAMLARADLERANAEHADLLRTAKRGGLSLVLAEAMEQEIMARIADAKKQIADAEVPPLLQGLVGEQAERGWAGLTIPQRRQVIADVADIRVRRVGRHGNQLVPVRDRVEWHWLTGPGAGADVPDAAERIEAHFAARAAHYADRRARVMHLRAEGWTRQEIAAELGISVHTVKKDVDANRNGYRSVT
jgi:DNA invertase Pin-like site-specific DNA recombinase